MTGEFSRRSFLKYTALTAVVVAGSSLLTGCGGHAPVQHAVGTSTTPPRAAPKTDITNKNPQNKRCFTPAYSQAWQS